MARFVLLRSLSLLTFVGLFGVALGSSAEGLNGTKDTWGMQNHGGISRTVGRGVGLRGALAPLRIGLSVSWRQGLTKGLLSKTASSPRTALGTRADSSFAENNFTETDLADFAEAFALFDRNGDGQISTEELGIALRSLGQNPTARELQDAFSKFDSDRKGTLDLHEFIAFVASEQPKTATVEELRNVFTTFDGDADNFISAAELHAALTNLGEKVTVEEVEAMISEADMDQDGRINFAEFVSLMTSQ